MADRLNGGAIDISQGQYQTARSLIGDDFDNDLSRFVNVAGETDSGTDEQTGEETDSGTDEQTAETFNETRQTQQEFGEKTQQFRDTYEEYQNATNAGDTERARRLARELQQLQSQIDVTGAQLEENYDLIENQTEESLKPAQESIQQVRENVTSTTATVLNESLVATDIQITNVSERAAFDDPLAVKGQLVTANGTGVGRSDMRVSIPGIRSTTTTGPNGTFTITQRPVALPTGVQNFTVVATPNVSSVYQSATETISTDIEAVSPTLEITSVPERVGYGDPVSVEATVFVGEQPVEAVPLNMTLDGVLLDRNRTRDDGQYAVAPELPANINNGTTDLSVRVGWDGRAIESVEATRAVTIEQTPTVLSIDATNGTNIEISGTLQTSDGIAVDSQPVQIRVDGRVVETVGTNESGGYATTLSNATVAPNEAVTVSATYDTQGSNLGPSRASISSFLSSSTNSNPGGESGDGKNPGGESGVVDDALEQTSDNPVFVSGLLIIMLVASGLAYRRYTSGDGGTDTSVSPVSSDHAEDETESLDPRLTNVEAQLEQGQADEAAVTLYALFQSVLKLEADDNLTHWELYRAVRDSLSSDEAHLFEQATTLYERARFAPSTVSAEQVRDVLGNVHEQTDPTTSEQPADD